MRFKVVAEKSHGIYANGERIRNPFLIRDIFSPSLHARTERRTWTEIEASDEHDLRRMFDEAVRGEVLGMSGFKIVSVERTDAPPDDAAKEPAGRPAPDGEPHSAT